MTTEFFCIPEYIPDLADNTMLIRVVPTTRGGGSAKQQNPVLPIGYGDLRERSPRLSTKRFTADGLDQAMRSEPPFSLCIYNSLGFIVNRPLMSPVTCYCCMWKSGCRMPLQIRNRFVAHAMTPVFEP